MPTWQDVLLYVYGRWIWFAAIAGGILLFHNAIKAGEDRWQSRLKRIDRKVIDCMEEHVRKAQTDGSKSRTVSDICKATGLPEKRVTDSLHRLQREHKVWEHNENYFVI